MKLHIGCGNKKINGFINVDLINTDAVDVIDNAATLDKFNKESAELIYACHILEHFKRKEYFNVLKRWTEILKYGGILRISVPDFSKIAEVYVKGLFPLESLLGLINGGQTYLYNFHYMNFDFKTLKKDLESLGYTDIKIWDWRNTEHANIDDFSQAYLPHMDKKNGILMSLNIEAVKKIKI